MSSNQPKKIYKYQSFSKWTLQKRGQVFIWLAE